MEDRGASCPHGHDCGSASSQREHVIALSLSPPRPASLEHTLPETQPAAVPDGAKTCGYNSMKSLAGPRTVTRTLGRHVQTRPVTHCSKAPAVQVRL